MKKQKAKVTSLKSFKIVKVDLCSCPTKGLSSIQFTYIDAENNPNWHFLIVSDFNKETFFKIHEKTILELVNQKR
jgi:hypothetical protein